MNAVTCLTINATYLSLWFSHYCDGNAVREIYRNVGCDMRD